MKKLSKLLWGIVLIAVGVIIALNIIGILHINYALFFKGWWTLFIIVPFAISLISKGPKTSNLIGLFVGVILLLGTRNIIDFDTAIELIFPGIIIIIGIMLIAKSFTRTSKNDDIEAKINEAQKDGKLDDYTSTFSGQTVNFNGEVLKSCTMNAIFGGIKCDLNGAIIEEDVVIEACAIFGGIDFIVPDGMNLKIKSTSIFGGTSGNKPSAETPDTPTVYVKGTCIFGGISIK